MLNLARSRNSQIQGNALIKVFRTRIVRFVIMLDSVGYFNQLFPTLKLAQSGSYVQPAYRNLWDFNPRKFSSDSLRPLNIFHVIRRLTFGTKLSPMESPK
jgi:hypothetical protein